MSALLFLQINGHSQTFSQASHRSLLQTGSQLALRTTMSAFLISLQFKGFFQLHSTMSAFLISLQLRLLSTAFNNVRFSDLSSARACFKSDICSRTRTRTLFIQWHVVAYPHLPSLHRCILVDGVFPEKNVCACYIVYSVVPAIVDMSFVKLKTILQL